MMNKLEKEGEGVMRGKKPICVVAMTLHKRAEEQLSQEYQIADLSKLDEAEALLCYGVPDEWMGRMTNIRAVGCHSCSERFRTWAMERGIQVKLADSLWRTVAELTLGLALSAARFIPQSDAAIRNGLWTDHETLKQTYSGSDFQQKNFCILGMGQIGIELAKLLTGFNMNVCYYDIVRRSNQEERALQISYMELPKLLACADYFALLLPHNAQTDRFFGKEQFSMLKKGCIFINTARPWIVDREAFVEAMTSGHLGAAALDVAWEEAMVQKSDILGMKNLIMTPHLGGSTYECDYWLVEHVKKICVRG